MLRPDSKHRVISQRSWWDSEPDRIRMGVELDSQTGEAFIVFTCSSTWLRPEVVRDEVIPWLEDCANDAVQLNDGGTPPLERVWWELEIPMAGLGNLEDDVLDVIDAHDLGDLQWSSNGDRTSAFILESFDKNLSEDVVRQHMFAHQFSAITRIRLAFPEAEIQEPILTKED